MSSDNHFINNTKPSRPSATPLQPYIKKFIVISFCSRETHLNEFRSLESGFIESFNQDSHKAFLEYFKSTFIGIYKSGVYIPAIYPFQFWTTRDSIL